MQYQRRQLLTFGLLNSGDHESSAHSMRTSFMLLFMPSTTALGDILKHNDVNDTAIFLVLDDILNVSYITIYW